jgi:hypothetical protein
MKNVILFLIVAFAYVYSAPKINAISPYINGGVSMQLQMSYNPLTIEYNYKREASGDKYVAYANDIYLRNRKLQRDGYIAVGSKDEKNELLATAILASSWKIQAQYKGNVFEGGENNLFQNISVSPFLGTAMARYQYSFWGTDIHTEQNNGYVMLYGGTALGTRKKVIDNFSYIEIFTAPQLSLTYYGGLGGGEDYNPVNEIHPNWGNDTNYIVVNGNTRVNGVKPASFSQTMYDFTLPIGVGFKRRWFFVKGGIAISTTFGGEKRNIKGGVLTVDSHNLPQIPFFAEIGFHFRKFKQLERENND